MTSTQCRKFHYDFYPVFGAFGGEKSPKYKYHEPSRRETLLRAAVVITYISGGNYYLHLRRELLLTSAAGVITYITVDPEKEIRA